MITKDKLIEYHLANEKARYEAIKAITTSFKQVLIALIVCLTMIICMYMYFVVPVEEVVVDGNSKAAIHNTIDNESTLWQ